MANTKYHIFFVILTILVLFPFSVTLGKLNGISIDPTSIFLNKSGWVKSNTSLDGRFYINLNEKGNRVLSKVFSYWSKAQEQVKNIR